MSRGIQHLYATLPATYIVGGTADTTVETVFHTVGGTTKTGGYITVPAGTCNVGDYWEGFALLDVTGQNSTDTLDLALYLGPTADPTTGLKLVDYAALDAATTAKALRFSLVCELPGTVSVCRFSYGGLSWNTAATALSQTIAATGADAQLSTLVENVFAVTGTWSVSHADNIVRMRAFHVIKYPALPSV